MKSELILTKTLFELDRAPEKMSVELLDFLLSCTYPWELLGGRLHEFLLRIIKETPSSKRIQGFVHPSAVIEGDDVVIEEGATVEAGVCITGPTFLANGAVVRHGAYIRGDVYAGAEAIIGHTTEVKGSILLARAKAAHFAYVGNSLLGFDTNLGAGTKLANMRFDHGLVSITKTEPILQTGLKKLGAILGNRAQTGCNSVTNPGTVLTVGSYIKPTEVASGVVHRPLPKI